MQKRDTYFQKHVKTFVTGAMYETSGLHTNALSKSVRFEHLVAETTDLVIKYLEGHSIDAKLADWQATIAMSAGRIWPMEKLRTFSINAKEYQDMRDERAAKGKEPSSDQVQSRMKKTGQNFFQAREEERNLAYGGTVPTPFASWGDYWKSLENR